jgi:hypothetical protein
MKHLPTGLLWHDNDTEKTWQQRVKEAAERYQQKFFIKANRCYVNGKTVDPRLIIFNSGVLVEEIDGIQVYLFDGILPNTFFCFREGENEPPTTVTQPAAEQMPLF